MKKLKTKKMRDQFKKDRAVLKKLLGPKAPTKLKVKRNLAHYCDSFGGETIACLYSGDLIKDKKNKYLEDGSLYLDHLFNIIDVHLPHGKGISEETSEKSSNSYVYSGEWSKGFKHGYGIELWSDSVDRSYKGNWKFGQKHGKGKLTYNTGESFVGLWNDGLFWTGVHDNLPTDSPCVGNDYFEIKKAEIKKKIKRKNQQALSKGILYYRDGSIYEGEFVNINPGPHGKGIMTYQNGIKKKGKWRHGKLT